jgi:hypothetical protein
MRKTIIALAGAVAAAATISATALATAGTAAASAHAQTITLKATPASLTCVPIPGQKPTGQEVPGDQCVMSEKLTRYGAPYGHDAVHCTVVTLNDLVCTAAWMLPRGQITVAGDGGSTTGQLKVIPVVGGTGAYDAAQGYVVITNTGSGPSTVVFHLVKGPIN